MAVMPDSRDVTHNCAMGQPFVVEVNYPAFNGAFLDKFICIEHSHGGAKCHQFCVLFVIQ
jgi:hypothetical protein